MLLLQEKKRRGRIVVVDVFVEIVTVPLVDTLPDRNFERLLQF